MLQQVGCIIGLTFVPIVQLHTAWCRQLPLLTPTFTCTFVFHGCQNAGTGTRMHAAFYMPAFASCLNTLSCLTCTHDEVA